ncbi:helix-turn-helix transcriptional regulator, partial [Paenibacillus sp. MCAF20]
FVIMTKEALRAIRIFHDMTQSEFSAALNVSQSCVASAESGYRGVSDKLRVKVAQRFGMGEDVLNAIAAANASANLAL